MISMFVLCTLRMRADIRGGNRRQANRYRDSGLQQLYGIIIFIISKRIMCLEIFIFAYLHRQVGIELCTYGRYLCICNLYVFFLRLCCVIVYTSFMVAMMQRSFAIYVFILHVVFCWTRYQRPLSLYPTNAPQDFVI